MEAVFPWLPVALIGVLVWLADRILNGILIVKQVMALVWLAGILAVIVLLLLSLCYLKKRQGGDNGDHE